METSMTKSVSGSRVAAPRTRHSARAAQGRSFRLNVTARALERDVGLMGTKAGMTSIFSDDGKMTPCTVVGLKSGCFVTHIKTVETDGCPALRHLAELKREQIPEGLEVGAELDPTEMFSVGDKVDVAGKSVGKGFAGGIKRHGFSRGLMTHGSKSHREHGTTGPGSTPSRVYPGTKHPGQMGDKRV